MLRGYKVTLISNIGWTLSPGDVMVGLARKKALPKRIRYGLSELKHAHVTYHVIAPSLGISDWLDCC